MPSRLIIAALATALAATSATAVAAEPTKAPPQEEARSENRDDNRPAEVLLASRSIATPGEQSDGQASPPPKRKRAARVTTCRCGGSDSALQQP